MYKTLPTCNHLWTFKKQFAIQLALSGFMSYMLQIGGRSPNKILFAKNTGKVFQNDFHPAYDVNGIVEFTEPVPLDLREIYKRFLLPSVLKVSLCHLCVQLLSQLLLPRINIYNTT
ncbi:hypothetical protein O6H91_Y343000 [Diphasiastrum complanatum]|nr:hypothetical protein O6H91_Y343000 [Diphasiastrum complanatum]